MATLQRLEKRNQVFNNPFGKNREKYSEKFRVLLRKKNRCQKIMSKRITENLKNLENAEKKVMVCKIVEMVQSYSHDENVILSGLYKLVEIFTKKSDFLYFWDNGVFDLCLWVIETKYNNDLLEAGTDLLANLSVGNSCYCEEMVQRGILEKIFFIIDKNLQIADNCLWTLNNLINGSQHNATKVLSTENYFNKLLHLAGNKKLVKKTKILSVFTQLCTHTSIQPCHTQPIFDIFLTYLTEDWAVNSCITGLSTLSASNKPNLKKILEAAPNIFEKIITFTEHPETLNTLKFLSNFSFFEDFTQVLLDNKILPYLRRVLGSNIQGVKKIGFFILSNLLNSEELYFCTVMADKELINLIIACVNEQNYETRFEVWVCLRILCNRTVFYYGGIFDNLIFNMHLAFETETDARILMEMLESFEAILRNAGNMLDSVQEFMDQTLCFDMMARNRYHKNREVADKVEFIIDQYYNRELLYGIEDTQIVDSDILL